MITRRALLIGGGAGAGLLVAYALWPREYAPNLRAGPGEMIFNAFLKIGTDGRVTVVVPQAEMGQGVYTALPQILADELGADWRTVGVEPAAVGPLYANTLLAAEFGEDRLGGAAAAREWARRNALMLTGASSSVRMFETPLRGAGAGARVLLCKAAAARWDVRWEECDAQDGFVVGPASAAGTRRLRFGELADAAAALDLPDAVPLRASGTGRLSGHPLPRIDTPAKLDGSARFAGDVRLPGMVYASVRQGPPGATGPARIDKASAQRIAGTIAVVERPGWVAAVASNWWAADRAAEALGARFSGGAAVNDATIADALAAALATGEATRFHDVGDADAALASGSVFSAEYRAAPAPHAALETLTATARFTGDRLEVWAPTQTQSLARAAAARAGEVGEARVTLYPMLIGGGFGRAVEVAAIEQAVVIARAVRRPVQLVWSRPEDIRHDAMRPPVHARLTARVAGTGLPAWRARIAVPSAVAETAARITEDALESPRAEAAAVEGAVPPYGIAAVAVEHVPVAIGRPAGIWRGRAHSYTAFFTESFIDELARKAGIEPFSFRMGMLGANPRFARVLSAAAALGGWDGGGPGSAQGIAAHACVGSVAAAIVEVRLDAGQRIRVTRVSMVVDVGRVINPELVRQQIEGGIIWGIAAATGSPIEVRGGLPNARTLSELGLPLLGDTPEMRIEILPSLEPPGGAEEVAVPPIAPAIANAVFAAAGQRLRTLPLRLGGE